MTERTVRVWGKFYAIRIYQRSKTVWIAEGDFEGKRITAKGSSGTSAAAHWQRAAQETK